MYRLKMEYLGHPAFRNLKFTLTQFDWDILPAKDRCFYEKIA